MARHDGDAFARATVGGVTTTQTLTPAQIYATALAAGFNPEAAKTMTAIVLAESGGNPTAICDSCAGVPEYSVGLAAINMDARPGMYTQQQLEDPLQNLEAAYQISDGGTNWQPWTTYIDGKYLQFQSVAEQAAAQVQSQLGLTDAELVSEQQSKSPSLLHQLEQIIGHAFAFGPYALGQTKVGQQVGSAVGSTIVSGIESIFTSRLFISIGEVLLGVIAIGLAVMLLAGIGPADVGKAVTLA